MGALSPTDARPAGGWLLRACAGSGLGARWARPVGGGVGDLPSFPWGIEREESRLGQELGRARASIPLTQGLSVCSSPGLRLGAGHRDSNQEP